jgi:OOP family OmpA-OmpF porin
MKFTVIYAIGLGTCLSFNSVFAIETDKPALDADYDGVPDAQDRCLGTPLVKKVDPKHHLAAIFSQARRSSTPVSVPVDEQGCAKDSDKDGVADYLDYCPENSKEELSAGVHSNGCPLQSDGDGTPDYRDHCPDTKRGVPTDRFGCPV